MIILRAKIKVKLQDLQWYDAPQISRVKLDKEGKGFRFSVFFLTFKN